MSVDAMRQAVVMAYPGDNWKKRVQKMSDDQVIAVYKRLRLMGKIK